MAQFLQSIDSDNNSSNGIKIDTNMTQSLIGSTLDFEKSELISNTELNQTVVNLGKILVSENTARMHINDTLAKVSNIIGAVDTTPPETPVQT